jgi:drug/metabolite transporter (DMT)-like permease
MPGTGRPRGSRENRSGFASGARTRGHHAWLSLFTVIWGANFILAEVALREMAPISFSAGRFAAGALALSALLWTQYRTLTAPYRRRIPLIPRIAPEDWPRLLLAAVAGAALAPWLGIEGLGLTNGARASLWLAIGPLLSSVLGRFTRTERIGRTGYVGTALACAGAIALAADGLMPRRSFWLGDLLLFGSILLVVWELHLIKPLARGYGATPIVTLRTVLGGVLYTAMATPFLIREPWADLSGLTWFAMLAGGAVGVGMGQWIKVRALNAVGPTRVVLYGNLVPVSAFVIAWIVLGDSPSILEVTAAVMVIAGAVFLQVLDASGRADDAAEQATRADA